jgi:anti-anti-sigma factor
MKIQREETDGNVVLGMEGGMTIYDASMIREEMLVCFKDYEDVTLDLRSVDRMDLAGMQLLVAAGRTSKQTGKPFQAVHASEAIRAAVLGAGMDPDQLFTDREG